MARLPAPNHSHTDDFVARSPAGTNHHGAGLRDERGGESARARWPLPARLFPAREPGQLPPTPALAEPHPAGRALIGRANVSNSERSPHQSLPPQEDAFCHLITERFGGWLRLACRGGQGAETQPILANKEVRPANQRREAMQADPFRTGARTEGGCWLISWPSAAGEREIR
ncbi:uncharacterized protein VTP21DRAFT_4731 [Calcarisporiella thermophila]|uniref:uncharacterized protein n=1 Tax=Calcarisporiella thermophila TaxID=911321 RepID=UPI003742FAD2